MQAPEARVPSLQHLPVEQETGAPSVAPCNCPHGCPGLCSVGRGCASPANSAHAHGHWLCVGEAPGVHPRLGPSTSNLLGEAEGRASNFLTLLLSEAQ